MKLSIIVPAFNRKNVLEHCLQALIPQLCAGEELIVVDDASDWPVREYLEAQEKEHDQLKVYHLQNNCGQGHARNHGASLASSQNDIIVFIDSDVLVMEDTLQKIRHFFELYPDTAALTGRLKAGSEDGEKVSFFTRYKNSYMNFIFGLQACEVNFLYGSICAVRSADFVPWPEKFLGVEDTELGMKMVQLGKKITFMAELEVTHLKNYGLWSILKNDFMVPFGFARCFWLFAGWQAYIPFLSYVKDIEFSHIKPFQVYSLLTVVNGIIMAFIAPYKVTLAFLGLFLLLNLRFFWFLGKVHSLPFFLRALPWTLFDQIVMFFGAISGLIYHGLYLSMKKLMPSRPVGDSVEK